MSAIRRLVRDRAGAALKPAYSYVRQLDSADVEYYGIMQIKMLQFRNSGKAVACTAL
jgi:hypothetical protein